MKKRRNFNRRQRELEAAETAYEKARHQAFPAFAAEIGKADAAYAKRREAIEKIIDKMSLDLMDPAERKRSLAWEKAHARYLKKILPARLERKRAYDRLRSFAKRKEIKTQHELVDWEGNLK
jgi:hypothetical protein